MLVFLLFRVILDSNLLNKHRFSVLESDARNVKVLPFNYICNCWITKFPVQYIIMFKKKSLSHIYYAYPYKFITCYKTKDRTNVYSLP